MSLEQLSDPELSHLAYDLKDKYQLIVENTRVSVLDVINNLFEVDEDTHWEAREFLIEWLYAIADAQEFNEPEEEKYRPMGYRGSWMEEQDS